MAEDNLELGRAEADDQYFERVARAHEQMETLIDDLLALARGEQGVTDHETVTVGQLADGFYVADDGPEISPEERERVFESGHPSAGTGAGFGLSIVAQVVEAHGWEITVTESATGGARFEISGVITPGE